MFQEKLKELRPYVSGIRFVKDLPVVDLILKEDWHMFESDTIVYRVSSSNENYYIVYPKNPEDSIDNILGHVKNVIHTNIEKENKLKLLKVKIEELKRLFNTNNLDKLNRLKFEFEEDEITLDVEPNNLENKKNKTYQGVELPPKISNGKLKEEV
jgi:hypothetical protein